MTTDNWTPPHRPFQSRRKPKKPTTVPYDIAFTQEDDGTMLLHWANCKHARTAAALGKPVATLYGCEILPTDTKRCECMNEAEPEK